jgi:hypothetical protein
VPFRGGQGLFQRPPHDSSFKFPSINDGRLVTGCTVRGSNPGWRFPVPGQTVREAHTFSCTMSTGSFPGVKRPGRVAGHTPLSSADVANGLELFLRLPFCACIGGSWSDLYLYI